MSLSSTLFPFSCVFMFHSSSHCFFFHGQQCRIGQNWTKREKQMHLESLRCCFPCMLAECFELQPFVKCRKCIKDEGEVLLVLTSKVKETKHLWMRMEMGQDTYRDSAFAGFSLGVTMVTYPISLPTYLPACLPLAHKLHTRSCATGFAPERTSAALVWRNPGHILSCFTAERENLKL